ncbi:MAG: heavy metal-binding domain-containing protein [Sphaerochaetaceae bacterium]
MVKQHCDLCSNEISVWVNPYNYLGMDLCSKCYDKLHYANQDEQKQLEIINSLKNENSNQSTVDSACKKLQEKVNVIMEQKEIETEKEKQINLSKESFLHLKKFMVTSSVIVNHIITETLGMVNGECVIGSGALSASFASWANVFGTVTDKGTQKFIIARNEAEKIMLEKASSLEANAIVDVRYTFIEYSDAIQGILVSGTAVKLKPCN